MEELAGLNGDLLCLIHASNRVNFFYWLYSRRICRLQTEYHSIGHIR
jgi:hypothetical protein